MMLTINEIAAAMPLNEKENSTMTTESTGLFQGLAPLLFNRTVIMTVSADGKGLLTLNVIPKKVKDDENGDHRQKLHQVHAGRASGGLCVCGADQHG